ncbi:MAG: MFS transporter [Rhodococcus sp. (in: high G+C Gram-positive bacteria)]
MTASDRTRPDTSRPSTTETVDGPRRSSLVVVGICFFTVIFDGFDLVVFGAVIPDLLREPGWGLTPGTAGSLASLALIGMVVGSLLSAPVTDAIGRRKVIMSSVVWFTIFSGLCALASSPEMLGVFRFVGGIGLGLVIPAAAALTIEYAPRGRENFYNAVMMSGYAAGGIVSALVALALLPSGGWRSLFAVSVLPIVVVLPLVYFFLPESVQYLVYKGRRKEAEALASQYGMPGSVLDRIETTKPIRKTDSVAVLFSRRYLVSTALFGAAAFCGLFLIFTMNTGLPSIMVKAGYNTGTSLQFLLAFSLGGIVGVTSVSLLADKIGPRFVTAGALAAAAVAVIVLSRPLDTSVLLAAVAVAGLGTSGSTILINSFVATYYPTVSRQSALGWVMTVGRLGSVVAPAIIGVILGSGLGFEANFYLIAAVAVLGSLLILAVPQTHSTATAPVGIESLQPSKITMENS